MRETIEVAGDLFDCLVDLFGLEYEDLLWETISVVLEIDSPEESYREKMDKIIEEYN